MICLIGLMCTTQNSVCNFISENSAIHCSTAFRDSVRFEERDEIFWLSETDLIRSLARGTRALPSLLDRSPLERLAARTLEFIKPGPGTLPDEQSQPRTSTGNHAESTNGDGEPVRSPCHARIRRDAPPPAQSAQHGLKLCSSCRLHSDPLAALQYAAQRGPDVVFSTLTRSLPM